MGSDDVTDISETVESERVAAIARSVYLTMVSEDDWPHLKFLGQLNASGDPAKPVYMQIPDTVANIDTIEYDVKQTGETRNQYREIEFYEDPREFVEDIQGRNNDESNVDVITDDSGVKLHIYNDRAPTKCTTFDGEWLVFDAYDSVVDTTLQQSKSLVTGLQSPTWTHTGPSYPDLPAKHFPTYIARVKEHCFNKVAQRNSPLDSKDAFTGKARLRRSASRTKLANRKPNYGRK